MQKEKTQNKTYINTQMPQTDKKNQQYLSLSVFPTNERVIVVLKVAWYSIFSKAEMSDMLL